MKTIKILLILIYPITVISQISGNQVYGNSNYNNNQYNNFALNQAVQKRSVQTTDSTLLISTNILLNKTADTYLITIGTNHEAKTVLECNKAINARIANLTGKLNPFGVSEEDIYIDFISQTKIYDYEIGESQAEQYESGYEIKKNIIIKIDEIEHIDQLIELASEQDIFDLIKVEYVDTDVDKTYREMYKEALAILKSRLKLYTETCDIELTGNSRIVNDNFYAVSPKTQYKSYQAFETSDLSVYRGYNYSDSYIQKETRKQRTFYYEGVPTSGFDKIINADEPKIGLQYVFSMSMLYELEK